MNSPLGPVGFLDSGKEMKSRGRSNKQNKRFHGSNVKFKNAGSHRVSLKSSMENIAKSISSISKENFGTDLFIKNDEQMEGLKPLDFQVASGWDGRILFKFKLLDETQASLGRDFVDLLSLGNELAQKELAIRDELENILDHKDLLWRQKASCDWLYLGDQNTKFYRSHTIKRRKSNRISTLRMDDDNWCSDQDTLQSNAVEFFERLYGEPPSTLRGTPSFGFPNLNPSKVSFLEAGITDEEIKRALFDMAPESSWKRCVPCSLLSNSMGYYCQFQPISLCSALYKLIMKVIANKFKVVFPKLISQEQAGFIAGRNISDNIIIAQEVIHSMRCKQKGKNWIVVKLDLEKAYDRVSWEFIASSLSAAEIPISLLKVIMPAILSSSMQILRNRVSTPHLDQARLLDSILNQFCETSSHRISVRKSNIFFSKITSGNVRNQITKLFGFQEVQNLGKYLGVPFIHERVTKNMLNFIVVKVRQKLQSWDARMLSMAERITLAQPVLLSISNFFMIISIPLPPHSASGPDRQRLLTNSERVRRGIGHSSSCAMYGYAIEDMSHVLRECPFAKDVWKGSGLSWP
ncbi:reverse transcriptase like protein [Gossypium australe]|uniref:Reverse transcriptase like protein n=1 Tax=Gossypium australe TaxID=47621 RepID=A0A5B6X798_9ROSI|nr:reverse transcriptase like protein [Gossypium australe]